MIVPDMPGYGRSSQRRRPRDPFGDLADPIAPCSMHSGIATAHSVGNSYGGGAALRLALDHPKQVTKLVLMAPGGNVTTRGLPTDG